MLLIAEKTKVLAKMMSNEKEMPMISSEMAGGDCEPQPFVPC